MQVDNLVKRLFDILFSLAALCLLSPLLFVVALVVVIGSFGNPFYLGARVGKDGVPFGMWKFRTMVTGADRIGTGITSTHDPRVTGVGHFLRRTKLDELPQFFNVLCGDMSIVGPRAEVPEIVARYTDQQREVLRYKPGITGVGAIHYTTDQMSTIPDQASAEEFYIAHLLPEKLSMETEYERSRTFVRDIKVILSTLWLILNRFVRPIPTSGRTT